MTPVLIVDPEFQSLIPKLSADEYAGLEASLLAEGCRDALVVWEGQNILVDGHNRYEICTQHNLHFEVIEKPFDSREDVIIWMVQNQLARRNINTFTRAELALAMKEAFATKAKANQVQGGKGSKNLETFHTDKELAEVADVSNATIYKVEAVLESAPEQVKDMARRGEISTDRAYKLTKALEDADDTIRTVCLEHNVTDPQLVDLLNEKRSSETVQEVLASGRIQYNGSDDLRDRWLGEASAWDLQGLLKEKGREYRQAGTERARDAKLSAIQNQPDGMFSVIYADPPWQYDNSGLYGAAERHYPTMSTDEIVALPAQIELQVSSPALLFLWATNPLLPDAMKVIEAWGFTYKTNIVWDKEVSTTGLGFYVRGQHELLLIAVRGDSFTPKERPVSVLRQRKDDHSSKPDCVYNLIETMYPNQRYLELFAREPEPRGGWFYWGNEAYAAAEI